MHYHGRISVPSSSNQTSLDCLHNRDNLKYPVTVVTVPATEGHLEQCRMPYQGRTYLRFEEQHVSVTMPDVFNVVERIFTIHVQKMEFVGV